VQNSIICHNVYVGANCALTSCQVGPGYNLEAGSKIKSESLIAEDNGGVSEEIEL
jgi:ADP-glucose pyrophosphorylase